MGRGLLYRYMTDGKLEYVEFFFLDFLALVGLLPAGDMLDTYNLYDYLSNKRYKINQSLYFLFPNLHSGSDVYISLSLVIFRNVCFLALLSLKQSGPSLYTLI